MKQPLQSWEARQWLRELVMLATHNKMLRASEELYRIYVLEENTVFDKEEIH